MTEKSKKNLRKKLARLNLSAEAINRIVRVIDEDEISSSFDVGRLRVYFIRGSRAISISVGRRDFDFSSKGRLLGTGMFLG